MKIYCKNCGHQFEPFEHFVKLELRFDDALGIVDHPNEKGGEGR